MKIGFVLDDSLDKTDGVQQYVLTLGVWLTKQGHEVHYLVGETKRTDVKIHSLSKNIAVRFNRNRMSIPLPASRQAIRQLLETERFDILHVQMPYSPQLAARVVNLAPLTTAVVGTFHILPYGPLAKVATKALSLLLRNNSKRFDNNLSVSVAAQQFASQWYGIQTTVLPNVIDIKQYQVKRPQQTGFKIVFLGRLVERKGCQQLLEAVSLLPEQLRQQLTVIIGGKGPLQRRLVGRAEQLNIHNQVFFMGFIEESDKPAFLAQADIAIFPSLGGESFGIVLLEAMAAGAGVVMAGDNPGYSSVLGSLPASLFEPQRPRQLAEQLELFLREPSLREQLHSQQQKLVKQYDINVVGPRLLDIYKQAIAKRHPTKA